MSWPSRRLYRTFLTPGSDLVTWLIAFGLLLYVVSTTLAYVSGSAEIDLHDWRGFFEKANWYLFPIFLIVLGSLTIFSMRSFVYAWKSLSENQSIFVKSDEQVRHYRKDEVKSLLIQMNKSRRWWLAGIGLFLGLTLSAIEGMSTLLCHFPTLCKLPLSSLTSDCVASGATVTQNFSKLLTFECGGKICSVERDFSVFGASTTAKALMFSTQIMQSILIAIAAIFLLHVCINICWFSRLSLRPFRNSLRIGIKLNVRDEMGEFGLCSWNSALNVTLFVIAIGMIIPILSSKSQSSSEDDHGQIMIMFLVPLFFILPVLFSFIVRLVLHLRIKRNFYSLSETERAAYSEQAIWPFDHNFVSKVLVGVVAAEYHFLWNVRLNVFGSIIEIIGD